LAARPTATNPVVVTGFKTNMVETKVIAIQRRRGEMPAEGLHRLTFDSAQSDSEKVALRYSISQNNESYLVAQESIGLPR
jgi:hypothetical protein